MDLNTAKVARLLPARCAELLTECQHKASARLPSLLQPVFDKADDALFDLANKSDSSQRQNTFFDAMRELRLKRDTIEAGFVKQFNQEFEAALESAPGWGRSSGNTLELALVDDDEIEQSLASSRFVEIVRAKCKQQLYALEQRLAFLLSNKDLPENENPLGPHVFATAFRDACQHLDADTDIKLTLFKIFEKYTCNGLNELYGDINEFLAKHKILPTLVHGAAKADNRTKIRRTRVTIESEEPIDGSAGAAGDIFGTLQGLAASSNLINGAAASGSNVTDITKRTGAAGVAPGRIVATADLLNTLTSLQHGDFSDLCGERASAIDAKLLRAGNVNVIRTIRESGAIGSFNQTDTLTLDVVAILFDYVLDDPAIPDEMKALIGRLQLPMLKVALLDKTVFSSKTHPARQLLDTLAAAAVEWSPAGDPEKHLYTYIARLVKTIVDTFVDDIGLFAAAVKKLRAYLNKEREDADQRASDSTQSLRAREQIVLAKLEVDDAIKIRIEGLEMRAFIREFLLDYWRQLMIITHVEYGNDSDIWHDQTQTIEDLMWSIQPKSSPAERKTLTQKLPGILRALKRGMNTLEMEPQVCSKFMSMLASVHVVSVKRAEEAGLAEKHLFGHTDNGSNPGHEEALVPARDVNSEAFIKEGLARLFERKGVDPAEIAPQFDLDMFDDEAYASDRESERVDPHIMPFVERVTEMNLGDWVEFDLADGTQMRARFTWISPSTGRYLFTQRDGAKALDTTLLDLADLFAKDRARAINARPDPLFDRAIGDLISELETRKAAPSAP